MLHHEGDSTHSAEHRTGYPQTVPGGDAAEMQGETDGGAGGAAEIDTFPCLKAETDIGGHFRRETGPLDVGRELREFPSVRTEFRVFDNEGLTCAAL
jgi:hypothetical protein